MSANLFGMVFFTPPQTRHPERSASQMDRVTQSLWRGVEGPRRCLIYLCCQELFNHRARHGFSPGPRTKNLLASCVSQQILLSGFGGPKAPGSIGKLSTAEVLRLRAISAVLRDPSARRSAQDDGFVGGFEIQLVGYAENTKRSKKSQALRMTALSGALKYSWLDMQKT
jgi:hypothetical protein